MMLLLFFLGAWLAWAQESAPAKAADAQKPEQKSVTEQRTELNLLGTTDSAAGESRRNENVQFNLIDNNALKEINIRLGTSATMITEFRPDRKYFGTEFGNKPSSPIHLTPQVVPNSTHGALYFTRSDSLFSARSFFQVGGVKPAHENNYGMNTTFQLWRGAHLLLAGSQQKLRGSVNGNVLVPLASASAQFDTSPETLPYLAYTHESGLGRIVAHRLHGKADYLNLKPLFSSHLAAVLMSMALESKGVAWLPKSLTEQEMADGRLVRALDESWDIPLEIHLTRPTAPISHSAEEFWAKLGG